MDVVAYIFSAEATARKKIHVEVTWSVARHPEPYNAFAFASRRSITEASRGIGVTADTNSGGFHVAPNLSLPFAASPVFCNAI